MNPTIIASTTATGLVTFASIMQISNPSNICGDLSVGLMVYSAFMCRYCFKIKPLNMPLSIANGINALAQISLLRKGIIWERNEKSKILRRF